MKQDFYLKNNCLSVNVDRMKVHLIQSKNRIMMSVGLSVKNQMIQVLVKMIYCEILVKRILECNKACEIDEYLDIKNCSCEKNLIDRIILAFEDEILKNLT